MSLAVIGLGSNIDAEKNLKKAAEMLRENFPGIRFSSVVGSKPIGFLDQADFLNAVASIQTSESPSTVASKLNMIERKLGKAPPFRNGPRTIDLDLLLYDDLVLNGDLTIPHPRMHERRFVLQPLCELIDPQTEHPTLKKTWSDLLENTNDQQCSKSNLRL